ncbi:unnamed protein product, partial [Ectocarpus sp. 12 AP-2014]
RYGILTIHETHTVVFFLPKYFARWCVPVSNAVLNMSMLPLAIPLRTRPFSAVCDSASTTTSCTKTGTTVSSRRRGATTCPSRTT